MLVGVDQDNGVPELLRFQQLLELVTRRLQSIGIVRIDNENETNSIWVVVSPQWTNLVLSSNIPDRERHVFVVDLLDVETNAVKCERKEGGKRDTETRRERERERGTHRERERERERETERQRDRETERQRDRERQRETERDREVMVEAESG